MSKTKVLTARKLGGVCSSSKTCLNCVQQASGLRPDSILEHLVGTAGRPASKGPDFMPPW